MTPQTVLKPTNVLTRYQDGYRLARVINGMGQACKIVSVIIGVVILFTGLVVQANHPTITTGGTGAGTNGFEISPYGTTSLLAFLVAIVVGFIGWIFGVLLAAQGQILKAQLDTAVHNSPFLNDAQRIEVMSLS